MIHISYHILGRVFIQGLMTEHFYDPHPNRYLVITVELTQLKISTKENYSCRRVFFASVALK